jgi:hypothetical protein
MIMNKETADKSFAVWHRVAERNFDNDFLVLIGIRKMVFIAVIQPISRLLNFG